MIVFGKDWYAGLSFYLIIFDIIKRLDYDIVSLFVNTEPNMECIWVPHWHIP